MGFELIASFETLPEAFNEAWAAAFARQGFDIEFPPGVEMRKWTGDLIPIRVRRAPAEFIGFELPGDALAEIEICFHEKHAFFRTAAGRSTVELAVQCFGVALIASLTNGIYAYESGFAEGDEVLLAAAEEVRRFVRNADEDDRRYEPFESWEAVLEERRERGIKLTATGWQRADEL